MKLRLPTSRGAAWTLTILALAITLAWFCGRWYTARVEVGRDSLGMSHGCIFVYHNLGIDEGRPPNARAALNGPPFYWGWWGGVARGPDYRAASFPLWCIAIPALVTATLAWRPTLEEVHRRRTGRCPTCGYDRRGLGQAPCPECGTTPVPPPSAPTT